jgi:beta-galactosidase
MKIWQIVLLTSISSILLSINLSCQQNNKTSPQQIQTFFETNSTARQVLNFNKDWKFSRGDMDEAEAVTFNDSNWQPVRLPHDWAITGPFNEKVEGSTGKLPWAGVGWYRKTFTLDKADKGKRVYFDFDGVMAFPKVYVNGQLAGKWDYGYMSFRVNATPFVKFGEKNIIAVKADTRKHYSRWYPGAGIYRKIVMAITEPVHIAHWGTYITTPKVADESATINVCTTVENHNKSNSKIALDAALIDPDGKIIAIQTNDSKIPGNSSKDINQVFIIPNPQRWDITSPKLYTAKTIVRMGDKIVDNDATTFGIREFKFTADDGFHLNGRRAQLQGVCLHHDQGALGSAFNTRAMERQLEIMRDMGVNAIRTSHNPPAPEVLELCDKMGFVVWDEVFDKWDRTADRVDDKPPFVEYGEKQVKNFVLRDRNHPCVVVWSIGNEIPRDKQGLNPERVKMMADYFRKYDLTRPVSLTSNDDKDASRHNYDALDIGGFNYHRSYGTYHKMFPDRPVIYSESASAVSSRGYYDFPLQTKKADLTKDVYQVSSYDRTSRWCDIPDVEFNYLDTDKYVSGEFVWTGFDYLGEPEPFMKESRSSYFGIVDLTGIPKDRYYLYRSRWAPDKTTVHILPHWNWPDRIGQNVPVYIYTNGDTAELFLNGRSQGKKSKAKEAGPGYYGIIDKYRICFNDVNYEPGELKAVAYKDGKEIGQAIMKTAGEPASLRMTPDRKELAATGDDLCYLLIEAIDANGTLCPLADNLVKFKIEGPAEIAATDNGNPRSFELFQDAEHKLFYGKETLIIRPAEGQGGIIKIIAESDGLTPAEVTVQSK